MFIFKQIIASKIYIVIVSFQRGTKRIKIFEKVNEIDKQLLSESNKSYPAELALFAVSSSCRGKGIGKILFQSALEHMDKTGLKEFYLFTDTTCNYGFYEHQGMIRRLEKEHTFHIKGQQKIINFFIYDSSTQKKMSEQPVKQGYSNISTMSRQIFFSMLFFFSLSQHNRLRLRTVSSK